MEMLCLAPMQHEDDGVLDPDDDRASERGVLPRLVKWHLIGGQSSYGTDSHGLISS